MVTNGPKPPTQVDHSKIGNTNSFNLLELTESISSSGSNNTNPLNNEFDFTPLNSEDQQQIRKQLFDEEDVADNNNVAKKGNDKENEDEEEKEEEVRDHYDTMDDLNY